MKTFFKRSFLPVTVCILSILSSCSDKDPVEMPGERSQDIYFKIKVDNVDHELETIHYARTGKTIHFATFGKDGFPSLNITVNAADSNNFKASYPYYMDLSTGTCIIQYGEKIVGGYESHYFECPRATLVTSPGSLKIISIEREGKDEYVTGSFTVTVYQPIGICPYPEVKCKNITGSFRLKKAWQQS